MSDIKCKFLGISTAFIIASACHAYAESIEPSTMGKQEIEPLVTPALVEYASANEHPFYSDPVLTIPSVDTSSQAGTFQDVKLRLCEDGKWSLESFKMAGTFPMEYLVVDTVDTIVTNSFPVQVFLNVRGYLTNGCSVPGRISQRLTANNFEVVMYAEDTRPNPVDYACTAQITNFEQIIPLSVYGLSAGTYTYSLTGLSFTGEGSSLKTFTGTFNLAQDNRLSAF